MKITWPQKLREARSRRYSWHLWFAWRPVRVAHTNSDYLDYRWLEVVECRFVSGYLEDRYEYRSL
jgi:hypothetical protein